MDQDLKKAKHNVDLARIDLYLARHRVPTEHETMMTDLFETIKVRVRVNEDYSKEDEEELARLTALDERCKTHYQWRAETYEQELDLQIRIQEQLKLLKRSEGASIKTARNQA